jgi:hypothetical protein
MILLILWIVIWMDGLKRSMIALTLLALLMASAVAAQAYNRSTVTPSPSLGSHDVQEREQRGDMQGGAGMPGGMNPYWPVNVSMPPRVTATITPAATRTP